MIRLKLIDRIFHRTTSANPQDLENLLLACQRWDYIHTYKNLWIFDHEATPNTAYKIHLLCKSLTWGAVYVLQVIQGSSSTHVPQSNPLKYHLKVPQLPQRDFCPVPIISLMPSFAPDFPQVVLCLGSRSSTASAPSLTLSGKALTWIWCISKE